MKKLITIVTIGGSLATGMFFVQPKYTEAIDFDDPFNVLTSGTEYYEQIITTVLEVEVQRLADKVLNKIVEDSLRWANGGFDGDPGFVNNWDDFLKGTEHEVISGAFASATNKAQESLSSEKNEQAQIDFVFCEVQAAEFAEEIDPEFGEDYDDILAAELVECQSILQGNPGGDAQSNWNSWINGDSKSARVITRTIATVGNQRLNQNALQSLIDGEGETLTTLLGSKEAKENFKRDLIVGGWTGYIALSDPNNTDRGTNILVKETLNKEVNSKQERVINDIQTPQKFLNKEECENGGTPENGVCADGGRIITKTPGGLVGAQVAKSLGIEIDKGLNAKGLVGSLVKAIGALTDGLLSAGFSGLTDAAGDAFFSSEDRDIYEELGGGYQSQYDVLGILSDTQSKNNSGTNNSSSSSSGGINYDEFVQSKLQEEFMQEFEINLEYLKEEKIYYDQVRMILANSANILYEFDKCIPGADYDWEQRYKDNLSFTGNDDEETNQFHKIGFNEQKIMLQDPLVTIPGGTTLLTRHQTILDTAKDNSIETSFRIKQINSSIGVLSYLKEAVLKDFNTQKVAINNNLVIFESDWENLTAAAKASALETAYNKGYYLLLPSIGDVGGNVAINFASVIENDGLRAKKAVIALSWSIWEEQTAIETKFDLVKSYSVMQVKISSEDFVTAAKLKAEQLKQIIDSSYGLALDCMVFKMYAIGINRDFIATQIVFNDNLNLENKVFTAAAAINEYDPIDTGSTTNTFGEIITIGGTLSAGGPILGTIGGWLAGGSNDLSSVYFNTDSARTNEAILAFIESEYQLKVKNQPSVFTTTNMISPNAIEQSILGFETENELALYFDLYYPDLSNSTLSESEPNEDTEVFSGPGNHIASNKFEIKNIYKYDRVYANSNRLLQGMRGFMFCRTPGEFMIVNNNGSRNDISGSRCWINYYSASRLDYQLIISGINS
jgi:hypothetical protein